MKFQETIPPRCFGVGLEKKTILTECAHIHLETNEIVTFKTESDHEYDLGRKEWGYYATPSLNGRLLNNNLNAVLVKNTFNQYYVMLVETGKEDSFHDYLKEDQQQVVCWLNDTENLDKIEKLFK